MGRTAVEPDDIHDEVDIGNASNDEDYSLEKEEGYDIGDFEDEE